MTFEGQYLTYEEYIELGGSEEMGETPFNLLEFKSRRMIDIETFGRLKSLEKQPEEIKDCMFDLIETIEYDTLYKDAKAEDKEKYIHSIIISHLTGVIINGEHILYRG